MNKLFRISLNRIQLFRKYASKEVMKMPRFSESQAYQGVDKFGMASKHINSHLNTSYYESKSYYNKILLSFFSSGIAMIVYFAFLRGENEFDKIFSAPGYILASNLERGVIRYQIEKARASGEDTKLLEEELAYVDVKEAAFKARFDKDEENKNNQK